MLTLLSLALGTLVSEDLACIAAGLLVQRGQVGVGSAIAACAFGIFAGDVGLWGIGRACGRAALEWPWIARHLESARLRQLRYWLDGHAGWAILASRFVPGLRLPLYVIAGLIRLPGRVFAGWALLGSLLWTPILVLSTAGLGGAFAARMSSLEGPRWLMPLLEAVVMFVLLRAFRSRHEFSNPNS